MVLRGTVAKSRLPGTLDDLCADSLDEVFGDHELSKG